MDRQRCDYEPWHQHDRVQFALRDCVGRLHADHQCGACHHGHGFLAARGHQLFRGGESVQRCWYRIRGVQRGCVYATGSDTDTYADADTSPGAVSTREPAYRDYDHAKRGNDYRRADCDTETMTQILQGDCMDIERGDPAFAGCREKFIPDEVISLNVWLFSARQPQGKFNQAIFSSQKTP
jgi:hypothetical protein